MFNIKDRVVCVDASKLPHTILELEKDCPNFVKEGKTYTIRAFHDNGGIVTGVLLEEIVNPIRYFSLIGKSQESSFKLSRFEKMKEDRVEVLSEQLSEVV